MSPLLSNLRYARNRRFAILPEVCNNVLERDVQKHVAEGLCEHGQCRRDRSASARRFAFA